MAGFFARTNEHSHSKQAVQAAKLLAKARFALSEVNHDIQRMGDRTVFQTGFAESDGEEDPEDAGAEGDNAAEEAVEFEDEDEDGDGDEEGRAAEEKLEEEIDQFQDEDSENSDSSVLYMRRRCSK